MVIGTPGRSQPSEEMNLLSLFHQLHRLSGMNADLLYPPPSSVVEYSSRVFKLRRIVHSMGGHPVPRGHSVVALAHSAVESPFGQDK